MIAGEKVDAYLDRVLRYLDTPLGSGTRASMKPLWP